MRLCYKPTVIYYKFRVDLVFNSRLVFSAKPVNFIFILMTFFFVQKKPAKQETGIQIAVQDQFLNKCLYFFYNKL